MAAICLLRPAPFVCSAILQGVLAEFLHFATVFRLDHSRNCRLYHYEEVCTFLEALVPLWIMRYLWDFGPFCPPIQVGRLFVNYALQNMADHRLTDFGQDGGRD